MNSSSAAVEEGFSDIEIPGTADLVNFFHQVLPAQITNEYKGSAIAKYIFMILTSLTVWRSSVHVFYKDSGTGIATIPIHEYDEAAQRTVLLIFAQWGLSQGLMGIVYVIGLLRYQSLLPLIYVLMFIEYNMRIYLINVKPPATVSVAPGVVLDKIMVPLTVILFFMSLPSKNREKRN